MYLIAIDGVLDFVKQNKLFEAKKYVEEAKSEADLLETCKLEETERESLQLIQEIIKNVSEGSINSAAKKTENERLSTGYQSLRKLLEAKKERKAEKNADSKEQTMKDQGPNHGGSSNQPNMPHCAPLSPTVGDRNVPTYPNFSKRDKNMEGLDKKQDELQKNRHASQAMQLNNPDIADLSDSNRPTKIGENFSELYDNEWTEIFDLLCHEMKGNEKETTEILLKVVQDAYQFCQEEADGQIKAMQSAVLDIIKFGQIQQKVDRKTQMAETSKSTDDLLKEFRKRHAADAVERLQKDFCDKKIRTTKFGKSQTPTSSLMAKYANRAVEVAWWMNVQTPPVYMCPTERQPFDASLYKAYTKSGKEPEFFVWPALKLYKDGGVLMKGVVQFR